jgi:TonB-linked SusC/RagA family outer membrane protein
MRNNRIIGAIDADVKKMKHITKLLAFFLVTGIGWVNASHSPAAEGERKAAVTGISQPVPQQDRKAVKGKVVDRNGEAIPGATVQIVGSTRGVLTDENGGFSMENVAEGTKLSVSLIGMEPREVVFQDKGDLIVVLEEKANELDEVTVVAFGKQKKASVLAAITTVKPSELKVPSSNLTTAFAGRVAGLISYQQSGEPGQDNASFFIRGITSFGADAKKDPLILIDGMELTNNDLARLNTDDIASFSIMKDATAAALYGARGANGVILVTTKEGREGKAQVNVRLENSYSSPTRKIPVADPVTFMNMNNEAVITRNPDGIAIYTSEKIAMTERGLNPDIYPATDWYKTMFDNVTTNQRANLSISGGGTVARYYVAANITQDNGNLKVDKRNNFNSNIDLTKYAVRSNVNINLSKTTELVLRLSSSFDEYVGPMTSGADMYGLVMRANPVLFKPYYEPDEQFAYVKHILFGNSEGAGYVNPYAESLKGYKDYSTNTTLTQFEIKQKLDMITQGLSVRAMVNMNRYSEFTVTRQYLPYYYNLASFDLVENTYTLRRLNNGRETIDFTPGSRNINTTFYLESAAEYNRDLGEKHHLNALLVYIMQQRKEGLASTLQLSLPNRNLGLSGRLAYNYDSRYFAEFNFGYNGSERFSLAHRWGFFPSIGAAWMLSNEEFFEPVKGAISQFKLKGTYGMVGNDAIGSNNDRFYYLADVNLNASRSSNWGINPGMAYNPGGINVSRYANDKIGWETAYKTNFGIEAALVNGLSANIDFFHERRENILLSRIIPATMGVIPAVKANLGVASGRGVDMELNYEKVVNKNLWFTGRGTFTYATSKVLEWEEPDYSATPYISRVGYSINQGWGLVAERLFVDETEVENSPVQYGLVQGGDIKYRDINDDGRISDLDLVPIGLPTVPEINYGFGLSAGYRGCDVSFFFQGSARQSFWLDLGNITPFIGERAIVQPIVDSYWSESNRDPYAFWPRLANYSVENNTKQSTWFMQDATFFRLKSAEIGYTAPQNIARKIYLTNLRVYVSATNLLCWSRFKLWDPEMAGNGLGYPLQRVINVGLNIGF